MQVLPEGGQLLSEAGPGPVQLLQALRGGGRLLSQAADLLLQAGHSGPTADKKTKNQKTFIRSLVRMPAPGLRLSEGIDFLLQCGQVVLQLLLDSCPYVPAPVGGLLADLAEDGRGLLLQCPQGLLALLLSVRTRSVSSFTFEYTLR